MKVVQENVFCHVFGDEEDFDAGLLFGTCNGKCGC